jgi:glycosyltransferase 2 family protein
VQQGRWKLWLRFVASALMLGILLSRVHFGALFPELSVSTFGWFAAALVVTIAGVVMSAVRWDAVLRVIGCPANLRHLVSHYFAGLFVGNFLPSTIGGDVLRVSRLAAENGDRPGSFASVVIERLTGWVVLPILTLGALAVSPELRSLGTATRLATGLSVGTLALLVVILVLAGHPGLGGRLQGHESWLRFIGAVHFGIDRLRRDWPHALLVLLVGFAYQFTVVLAAWLGAEALGLPLGFNALLAFFPVVAIAQVLPISIGGLGLRESALVIFLSHSGLGPTTTQAVALGLLVYLLNLVASLLGAPAFAVGGRRLPTTSEAVAQ